MTLGRGVERAMAMSDAVWERHANPWSAWTRVPVLPLLCLAIWARAWIGWWCLVPVALLVLWTWINPRAFPPPVSTDVWASRAVIGERIWLARAERPIPHHHAIWAIILSAVSGLGLPAIVYGLWVYDAGWLAAGLSVTVGAKMWFLDRMVWLYQDIGGFRPDPPLPTGREDPAGG